MVYKNVKCPICGAPAPYEPSPNTGGDFYVMDTDDDCYDPKVKQYRCTTDPDHLFYIST